MLRMVKLLDSEIGSLIQVFVINIEVFRGMILYEFQDVIGRRRYSEGFDVEISDVELSEL